MYIVPDPTEWDSTTVGIGRILPEAIPIIWRDLEAFLALHPAWLTEVDGIEGVLNFCARGVYEAWVALSRRGDVEVLGICQWDRHKYESYYHILYLGGKNLRAYLKAGLGEAERYAYANGAAEIIFTGRWGWKRLLRRFGYGQPVVQLRKNVRKVLGH